MHSKGVKSVAGGPIAPDACLTQQATLVPIDVEHWPRRQHFAHFLRRVACTFSMTVELDVTAFIERIRAAQKRAYLAQVWAIATVVNRHEEFRLALTEAGEPAVWSTVHPSFTVFHAEHGTFSSLWAPYDPDFNVFYGAATRVLTSYADSEDLFPQGAPPPNSCDISSIPWTTFSGFTLNIRDGWEHLAPVVTLGRYTQRDEQVMLPVSVQVHHAAADGFHVSRLIAELGALFEHPDWVGE